MLLNLTFYLNRYSKGIIIRDDSKNYFWKVVFIG